MEWRGEGTVLVARRHGESAAILEVFTPDRGRHAGVVRGATSRKLALVLQPGSQVALAWRARLEEHLGSFTVEPMQSRAGLMAGRLELAGLNTITQLLSFTLPEREPHPRLYDQTQALLELMGESEEAWPLAYLHWELALLDEMGFGLDTSACAVTGATEGLAYVSPKTGRAVTEAGAGAWKERLLPLPPCLLAPQPAPRSELAEGLRTTGHFLANALAPALGEKPLPVARQRFVDLFLRQS
jgi:DNA repair protein RecO (recombination protein O)